MDEAAQQAIQIGVNLTIFIVALSISITLLLGVRDVAELAFEYDASIPTGSRVVSTKETNKRIVSGDELLSYYANYMTDINHERTDKFIVVIEDGSNVLEEETRITSDDEYPTPGIDNIKNYFKNDKRIDLSKDYEVITERYNEIDGVLTIKLKAIE